jgi:hypothetical protein
MEQETERLPAHQPSRYLSRLLDEGLISDGEFQALLPTGAQSSAELYALTLHFPMLIARALPDGNLARISALAAQNTPQAFKGTALKNAVSPLIFAKGAAQPKNVPFPIGSQIGFQAQASASSPIAAAPPPPPLPIDHHTALRIAGWPVRDQGQRGTCVAHAMAACKEAQLAGLAPVAAITDQSEQYIFWGAKQMDGTSSDGTLNSHALAAMRKHGVCAETLWAYSGTAVTGTVHQGPPPAAAMAAAKAALHTGGGVAAPSKALALYQRLTPAPVSIGVPVFADPANPNLDNWNVGGLVPYGRVAEPPPMSVVVGGHAVCVVGFQPDVNEPAGKGWFILRNSWGNSFGDQLPNGGYWGPEPGYGQISWSYIDTYLWEMCWL